MAGVGELAAASRGRVATGAPDASHAAPRRRLILEPWFVALVAVAAAIAVRVWFLHTNQAAPDGDEAMTGIMAQRILHGQSFIYLAGQNYNGALDQYLQAALHLVVGGRFTAFQLRLVQVGWAAAACALVFAVGRRMLQTPWHAALAAGLFAVGPYWNVWKGSRSHGAGYDAAVVVALAGLYCALRAGRRNDAWKWVAGFGLCCGLGVWLGLTSAYLLVPAGIWLLPTFVRSARAVGAALVGAVVGSLPATLWVVWHRRFPRFDRQPPSSIGRRWQLLSGPAVREFLGVSYVNGHPGWPRPLQTAAVVALGALFVGALVVRRQGVLELLTLRTQNRRPIDLLLLAVPVIAVLYCASPFAWYATDPRYLFVAYPVLTLGLAALVPSRMPVGPAIGGALFAVFACTSLFLIAHHADDVGPLAGPSTRDLERVTAFLVRHHETAVYTDYWTAMSLQFVADHRLDVAPYGAGQSRFPSLRVAVDAAPEPVYVGVTGPVNSLRAITRAFDAHDVRYTLTRIGAVTLLTTASPLRSPWAVGLGYRDPTVIRAEEHVHS